MFPNALAETPLVTGPPSFALTDQIALVTGPARGPGGATARALAMTGVVVFLASPAVSLINRPQRAHRPWPDATPTFTPPSFMTTTMFNSVRLSKPIVS